MSRFLRICAFLIASLISTNLFAAGYTCDVEAKNYVSCKEGYYLVEYEDMVSSSITGGDAPAWTATPTTGYCNECPENATFCPGGTDAPVYKLFYVEWGNRGEEKSVQLGYISASADTGYCTDAENCKAGGSSVTNKFSITDLVTPKPGYWVQYFYGPDDVVVMDGSGNINGKAVPLARAATDDMAWQPKRKECTAGYYCDGTDVGTLRNDCSAGTYCPTGSSAPTTCPAGSYCPGRSAEPTACPAGSYCPEGSSTPTTCTAGSYCPEGSTEPTACPSGWGGTDAGATSASQCYKEFTLGFNGATFAADAWSSLGIANNPEYVQIIRFNDAGTAALIRVFYTENAKFVLPDTRTESSTVKLTGGIGTATSCTTPYTSLSDISGAKQAFNIFSLANSRAPNSTLYLCAVMQSSTTCRAHKTIMINSKGNEVVHPSYNVGNSYGQLYMKPGDYKLYTNSTCTTQYTGATSLFASYFNNAAAADTSATYPNGFRVAGYYLGVTPETSGAYSTTQPINSDYLIGKYTTDRGLANGAYMSVPAINRNFLVNSNGTAASTLAGRATIGDNGATNIYVWAIANPLFPEYTTLEQVVDSSGQITGKAGSQTGVWQYTTTCPSGYSLVGTQGTYDATCEPSKFFITYDGGSATGGTAPTSPTECLLSETCLAPESTYTKPGYQANSWSCTNNDTGTTLRIAIGGTLNSLITGANQTLTCSALWSGITYTVHFDANGGTGTMRDQTMTYGTASRLSSNTFSRTGYTFAGWGTRAADTTATYTNGQSVSNLSDTTGDTVTLYAVWTPNETGRITLEHRDGYLQGGQFIFSPTDPDSVTVNPGSIKIKYNTSWHNYNTGTRIQKLTTNPSIPGFTFGGFYTNTQCQGEQMINENGNFVSASLTKYPTAGTTATWYACWKGNPYTVLFASNVPSDASTTAVGTMSEQTMYRNTYAQLTANAYELPGYTFNGWNTDADGSGTAFADKQSVTGLALPNMNGVILYAQWTPNTITIDWNENGGDAVGNSTCQFDQTVSLPTTTRTGYTFDGWELANGLTTTFPAIRCTYDTTGVYTGTTDKIKFLWHVNSINVVFDSNKPSTSTSTMAGSMEDQTFEDGVAQVLRSNGFSMRGYNFQGWALTPTGTPVYTDGQSVTNPGDVQDGTVTLYAIWEPQITTITVNKNGGSGNLTINGTSVSGTTNWTMQGSYDSIFPVSILPAWDGTNNALTRENMVFTGWSVTNDITLNGNVTINAVWVTPTCVADETVASASLTTVTDNAPVCSCVSKDGYFCMTTQTGEKGASTMTVSANAAQDGYYALSGYVFPAVCAEGSYSNASSAATGCIACPAGRTNSGHGKYNEDATQTCNVTCSNNANVATWAEPAWANGNTSNICVIATCNTGHSLSNNGTACTTNTINVVFNANKPAATTGEVSGTMTNQSFTYGVEQALFENTFTLPGYTFQGWATSADGEVVYENAQSVTNPANSTGDTANLYAVWKPITYTVQFNSNNGSGVTSALYAYTYDVKKALAANTFSKTGYTFAGWALTADGAAVYADKEEVSNLTTENAATVMLYAVWSAGDYNCAAGRYLAANTTTCSPCPAGHYCTGGRYTFNANEDQGISGVCASGYSTGGASTSSCTACTFGSANLPGASNHDAANDCQLQMGLNKNGGSGNLVVDGTTYDGTTSGSVVCRQGEECVLPDASELKQDGYDFTGRWGSNPSCTDGVTSVTYTTNADVASRTHYACKTPTQYTITYTLNGGTQADNAVTTYNITDTITLPTPTHAHGVFAGWFETSDLSGSPVTQVSAATGDKVFYAKWTCATGYAGTSCSAIVTGKINLNSGMIDINGSILPIVPGSINAAPTPIYIKYNTGWYKNQNAISSNSIRKLSTLPSIPGYNFAGFYTGYDCTGDQVIDAEGNFQENTKTMYTTAGETDTWYACYAGAPYTVSFNSNKPSNASTDMSGVMSDQVFYYGTSQALRENAFVLPGYTFTGWNTAADGSGTTYTDAKKVSSLTREEAITLYAQWTPNTITIDWDENGAEAIEPTTCTFDGTLTLPSMSRTGYTFNGWIIGDKSMNTGGATISCNYNTTGVYSGTSTNFKAAWTTHKYTITFKSGNTTLADQVFEYGTSQNLTAISSMDNLPVSSNYGWSFKGWATNYNTTDITYKNGANIHNLTTVDNDNITLYAVWERSVPFTYYDGATATTPTTVTQTQYYHNTTNRTAATTDLSTYTLTKNTTYGWEPLGWAMFDTDTTTATIKPTATTVSPLTIANARYYAIYSRPVSLTYSGNNNTGGSTESTTDTQYYNCGSSAAINLSMTLADNGFTRTGYHFNKWALNSTSGTQYDAGASVSFPNTSWTTGANANVFATWTPNTYTVTFKSGNATLGSQEFEYDASQNLNAISGMKNIPVSSTYGWKFAGWATSTGTTTTKYDDGASVNNLTTANGGNYTLYAVWKRDIPFTYYATANASNPTTSNVTQYFRSTSSTAASVTSVTAPSLMTSTNGWEPYAWVLNNVASASTAKTFDGTTLQTFLPAYNSKNAYYAVYGRTPTIVYDGNGATSGTMANETAQTEYLNAGDTLATQVTHKLAKNQYAKSGYEFNGWTYSSKNFEDEATVEFAQRNWMSTQDFTLIANWGDGTFILTLDPDEFATTVGTETLYTTYSKGVYLDSARTKEMTTSANRITVPETKFTVSFESNSTDTFDDVTTIKEFRGYMCMEAGSAPKVCIEPNGYMNAAGLKYAKEMSSNDTWHAYWLETPTFQLPTPAARTGYTFKGWYTDSDFTNKAGDAGAEYEPTDSITLYGLWEENIYTLSIKNPAAAQSLSRVYEKYNVGWYENMDENGVSGPISMVKVPAREGYTLRGLYTEEIADVTSNGGTGVRVMSATNNYIKLGSNTTITADTELFTAWAQNCVKPDHGNCTLSLNPDGTVIYITTCESGYTLEGNGTATPKCAGQRIDLVSSFTFEGKNVSASVEAEPTPIYLKPGDGFYTEATGTEKIEKLTKLPQLSASCFDFKGFSTLPSNEGTQRIDATGTILDNLDTGISTLYAAYEPTGFTITYDEGNGNTTQELCSFANNTCKAKSPTLLVGYLFKGWKCENGGTDDCDGDDIYPVNAELISISTSCLNTPTLTAQWEPIERTITLDKNNDGANNITTGQNAVYTIYDKGAYLDSAHIKQMTTDNNPLNTLPQKEYDVLFKPSYNDATEAISAKKLTATYTFDGYYSGEENNNGSVNKMIDSNGYITSDGIYSAKNVIANSVAWHAKWSGGAIVLPMATRKGYIFDGWYNKPQTDTDATKLGDSGATYTPSLSTTLYAHWTPIQYTVTFAGNKPAPASSTLTGFMGQQIFTYNVPKQLPKNQFMLAGYEFVGWKVKTASDDISTLDDEAIIGENGLNLSSNAGDTITLSALWRPIEYTVHFDANGGTGSMQDQQFVYDTAQQLTRNTSIYRTDYIFAGWATTPDGAKLYDDMQSVENLADDVDEYVTLYAVWDICPAGYYCSGNQTGAEKCPDVKPGWVIADKTGVGDITGCAIVTTPDQENSPIAQTCSAGKLQMVATADGEWSDPVVIEPLKASAGQYVNGTTCSACTDLGNGYTASDSNNSGGASVCHTTCPAGQLVLSSGAACSTPNNTTYGSSWYTNEHTVAYGSTSKELSLVNSCPTTNYTTPNDTTQSNHDASTDCTITCAAGTVVASVNANCTTPSGSWYSGEHTVNAGNVSTSSQKRTCTSGYATPNNTTQTSHDASTDCTITCAAGTIVANAGETCTTPSGNWYVASNTVQQGKTSTVNSCRVATNLFNPSNYKKFYGYIGSNIIKAYDKNAFVYIDAEPNTTYIVSGMGDATTTSGRYAFDMSATPAAGGKIINRVTAGGKGKGIIITTGPNTKYLGVFVLSDTDKATTSTRDNLIKANVKNLQIFKANAGYGITGNAATDHDAATDCTIICNAGEYVATAGGTCENVGAGYYFAGGPVVQGGISTRGQCTAPLTTIGYGYGANEADDCGRKLHAGENLIYLRSAARTTPSLRVKVGSTTFYGALSTSLSGALKVKKDDTQYSVVNDWE